MIGKGIYQRELDARVGVYSVNTDQHRATFDDISYRGISACPWRPGEQICQSGTQVGCWIETFADSGWHGKGSACLGRGQLHVLFPLTRRNHAWVCIFKLFSGVFRFLDGDASRKDLIFLALLVAFSLELTTEHNWHLNDESIRPLFASS